MKMLARMTQKQRRVDVRQYLNTCLGFRKYTSSLEKGRILGFYKPGNEILCSTKGLVLLTDAQLLLATFGLHCIELWVKVKVKVTLVQALRLCTGRTAHRGSRGIALPFHDHGTRRSEWSESRPGRSLPPGKTR